MKTLRYIFLYILIFCFEIQIYSQSTCLINGTFNTISTICVGQSTTLGITQGLNFVCYTLGDMPANLQNSLVSYYPFCGNSLDNNVMNPMTNDLSSVSGASLTVDRFGYGSKAFDFNGTSSYMTSSSNGFPTGNSARTITLWFYDRGNLSTGPDSIASSLFSCGGINPNTGFEIFHMGNSVPGSINLDFKGSGIISNTIKAAFNSWQFCAFVLDAASNYSVYINATIACTGTVNLNTANLLVNLGSSKSIPYHYFNGKIDDVFIYTRDLSQSEITQIYNINTPTTYSWSTGATTSSLTVSPTVTTVYSVTANNGYNYCNATSTVVVNTCVGIEEYSKNVSFQMYPNPTTGNIKFISDKKLDKGSKVIITNNLGLTVLELPFNNEIDVTQLNAGFYSLRIISSPNEKYTFKFIKE